MKKLIDFILSPWTKWKAKQAYKKRLADLRKRDPFIYK